MRSIITCTITCLLLANSSAFAIKPSNHYDRTPASLGITYDSLNIITANHQRITAWYCHSPKEDSTHKVIVLASADAGNMANNLEIVKAILSSMSADVLMFDYRGFGTSDPIDIDSDFIAMPQFAADIRAVVQYAQGSFASQKTDVWVYGRSMGASLAMAIAPRLEAIGGIIAESPYVTQEALKQYYTSEYKRMGSKRTVKIIAAPMLEPMDAAPSLTCPLLLIHGELEKPISSQEVSDLFAKCNSRRKVLWMVADADHMQAPYSQTSTFLAKLREFVWAE